MPHISPELASDWLSFSKESLNSRIQDTEQVTEKVLNAVQTIATHLDHKQELDELLSVKSDGVTPEKIIPMLHDVLKNLDSHDSLSQFIVPLYTALQFEDRSRQKLNGLLDILSVWATVRNDESITNEDIAEKLMTHTVTREQKIILSKYFPNTIQVEDENDDMVFF